MKKFNVLVLVLVAVLLVGCSAITPTPEEQLAKLGYEVTNEYFLRAARYGELEAVKLFLEAGININVREMDEKQWKSATALHYACDRKHKDVVEYLLEQGANINAELDDGCTPLISSVAVDDMDTAILLLENGANIKAHANRWTVLHYAVHNKNLDMVKLLVEAGAELEARTHYYDTPLLSAATDNSVEIVEYLLSVGADSKAKDIYGQTADSLTESDEIKEMLKKPR